MKNKISLLDKDYQEKKQNLWISYYSLLLCDIMLLNYQYNESKITTRQDLLLELPNLREFKTNEVNKMFDIAKVLLKIKYNLEITNDNPIKFKKNKNVIY